ITPDGNIVKLKKSDPRSKDMGSFLKMVQENTTDPGERYDVEKRYDKEEYIAEKLKKGPIVSSGVSSDSPPIRSSRSNARSGAGAGAGMSEDGQSSDAEQNAAGTEKAAKVLGPIVKDWLNNHISNIISDTFKESDIEPIVRRWLDDHIPDVIRPLVEKWIDEHLLKIASDIIEEHIQKMLKKLSS
ncbi:MAG: hypothetical protein LBO73_00045, partial [Holosporaceae bacterium]|nr:hypothetical protein [Holosporaceae bacterium]